VIAAYRLARQEVPNLQLALVGSMALDDPESWDVYRQIADEAAGDDLIDIFTNLTGVGSVALREGGAALWATLDGQVHAFCSERCCTEFLRGAGAAGR
jgi:hypothetical protein